MRAVSVGLALKLVLVALIVGGHASCSSEDQRAAYRLETAASLSSLPGPISDFPVIVRDGCIASDPHGMSLVACSQYDLNASIFLDDELAAVDGGALYTKSRIAFSQTRQYLPVVLCGRLTIGGSGDRWVVVESYRIDGERVPADSVCD